MSRSRTISTLVPPQTPLFEGLLLAVVVLYLTVSPFLLDLLGWAYGTPGGNPIEKIHPATWLLFLTLFLSASTRGNPLSAIISEAHRQPAVMIYVAAVVMLILQAILITREPFTTFIDTFLAPAVMYLLLRQVSERRGHRLALAIHSLFFINALVGIAEFVFGFRVTPFEIEGVELAKEWRSSALLGHPLSNALMTGAYVLALARGAGKEMPLFVRLTVFAVTALSMAVFGGRAATLVLVVFLVLIGILKFLQVLAGRKFDLRSIWFLLLASPVIMLGFVFFYDLGFFDRFLGRIFDDEGSAGTRIAMFQLFKHLSWYDLFFGADQSHLSTYTSIYGLEIGIESFWVSMAIINGLAVSIPFFAALFLFCWAIARAAQTGPSLWVLASFFAVASASLSLSAKTPDFTILVMMILVLFRRPVPEEAPVVHHAGESLAFVRP